MRLDTFENWSAALETVTSRQYEPRYKVRFGSSMRGFYTDYHAAQFARALELNGTTYTLEDHTNEQE